MGGQTLSRIPFYSDGTEKEGEGGQEGLKNKGERVRRGVGGEPFVAKWTSTDNPWHPAPGE